MLTLPADLELLQRTSHRVSCRLYTRSPVGGAWIPLRVVAGTPQVTYGRAGDIPGRTLTATVLVDTEAGESVLESDRADDLLYAPLSIFGSWIRAEQIVYRYDGSAISIPWGVYRLDRYVEDSSGALQITCSDPWRQVEDRKLILLSMGRITNGQLFGARIKRMLSEVFVGNQIRPWWTTLFDFGGIADRAYRGTGWTQVDSRGDAIKALAASWAPGRTIIAPRSGPAFKLVQPGTRGTAAIKAGGLGTLVGELADEVDRGDFFNEVAVTYSVERNLLGGRVRTEQRRAIAQYLDSWEELRANGPFGYVTRDAQTMDVADKTSPATADANARVLASRAIGGSLTQRRPIGFTCSPIYGLEQCDRVTLQAEPGGPVLSGVLIAADIPLDADGGDWRLTMEVAKTLDRATANRTSAGLDTATAARDQLDWIDLRPKRTIDLENGGGADILPGKGVGKAWRGWVVGGDKALRGGGTLVCTSAGGNVTLYSEDAWDEASRERRYRGWASVSGGAGTFDARITIRWTGPAAGTKAGAWKRLTKGKGGTIAVDTGVLPAAATRLSLRIETRGMKTNEQIRLNSAGMQYARDQIS